MGVEPAPEPNLALQRPHRKVLGRIIFPQELSLPRARFLHLADEGRSEMRPPLWGSEAWGTGPPEQRRPTSGPGVWGHCQGSSWRGEARRKERLEKSSSSSPGQDAGPPVGEAALRARAPLGARSWGRALGQEAPSGARLCLLRRTAGTSGPGHSSSVALRLLRTWEAFGGEQVSLLHLRLQSGSSLSAPWWAADWGAPRLWGLHTPPFSLEPRRHFSTSWLTGSSCSSSSTCLAAKMISTSASGDSAASRNWGLIMASTSSSSCCCSFSQFSSGSTMAKRQCSFRHSAVSVYSFTASGGISSGASVSGGCWHLGAGGQAACALESVCLGTHTGCWTTSGTGGLRGSGISGTGGRNSRSSCVNCNQGSSISSAASNFTYLNKEKL